LWSTKKKPLVNYKQYRMQQREFLTKTRRRAHIHRCLHTLTHTHTHAVTCSHTDMQSCIKCPAAPACSTPLQPTGLSPPLLQRATYLWLYLDSNENISCTSATAH